MGIFDRLVMKHFLNICFLRPLLGSIRRRIYQRILRVATIIRYHFLRKRFAPHLEPQRFDKVLFVAHPDDEILFFLSLLIREPGWLVVCATNGGNFVRGNEFLACVEELKLDYQLWNYPDDDGTHWNLERMELAIQTILGLKSRWTMVATHNAEGEYGHRHHKQLHCLVREVFADFNLNVPASSEGFCVAANELPPEMQKLKLELLKKCYQAQYETVIKYHGSYMKYEKLVPAFPSRPQLHNLTDQESGGQSPGDNTCAPNL